VLSRCRSIPATETCTYQRFDSHTRSGIPARAHRLRRPFTTAASWRIPARMHKTAKDIHLYHRRRRLRARPSAGSGAATRPGNPRSRCQVCARVFTGRWAGSANISLPPRPVTRTPAPALPRLPNACTSSLLPSPTLPAVPSTSPRQHRPAKLSPRSSQSIRVAARLPRLETPLPISSDSCSSSSGRIGSLACGSLSLFPATSSPDCLLRVFK
jgi:hypothetical protein